MPKLIKMWECVCCKQTWDSEEGAISCERKHKGVAEYEPIYEADNEFPDRIVVWFAGGISKNYYRE